MGTAEGLGGLFELQAFVGGNGEFASVFFVFFFAAVALFFSTSANTIDTVSS